MTAHLLAATTITPPSVSYAAISPMLAVFAAAVAGILVDAFAPRPVRVRLQLPIALAGLIGGLVAVALIAGHPRVTAEGAVVVDGPTLFLQATILALGVASVLLLAERSADGTGSAIVAQAATVPGSAGERRASMAGLFQTEVFPLAMLAIGGMLLFPASNDLLLMFVALEVLSLPLYVLCGLARHRRLLSQEAAVKYFLLGAFSSAFFLYGLALLYGYAGTVSLPGIARATHVAGSSDPLLYTGLALLGVGLLFKVSAAPFQSWTPDVYQGAPTPVTALMATGTKVAAFGALFRVFDVALGGLRWDWRPVMWAVAILTMLVGAVLAITQRDVKRMLAYSSIAHAGFILTGVVAATTGGLSGALFYLLVYGFTTMAAFGFVMLVRDPAGEATDLSRWAGLGKTSPLVAGSFAFLLLALAGIPLTSGFIGKFAVFSAAVAGGATWLVVVALVASAIAAFFYVRVIVLMFFQDPPPDAPTIAVPGVSTSAALALGLAVTVVLGVFPSPVLHLAAQAASSIR